MGNFERSVVFCYSPTVADKLNWLLTYHFNITLEIIMVYFGGKEIIFWMEEEKLIFYSILVSLKGIYGKHNLNLSFSMTIFGDIPIFQ